MELFVPALLEEFEATECRNTLSPGWLAGKMRGGWNLARGDVNAALQAELIGFRYANEEPSAPDENDTARVFVFPADKSF
jgi:hypothetical protein